MQTFLVEVLDEKAVPLLRGLESLAVIRLTSQAEQPPEKLLQKRSERFWGIISPEQAADFQHQLEEM